MNEFSYCRGKN